MYAIIGVNLVLGCHSSNKSSKDDEQPEVIHAEEFAVLSIADAGLLESKSGVQYELRFSFDIEVPGQPVYEASVDGYRLVPFLVVHAEGLKDRALSGTTLQAETSANDAIFLSQGGVSREVGRFRDPTGEADRYTTAEHPLLCEAQYAAVCRIHLQTRLNLDQTQTYETISGPLEVPQIEAAFRLEGLVEGAPSLSIKSANY